MDFVAKICGECLEDFDSLQVFGDYSMKKTQLALAALALAASSAAMADGVTVYGILDIGVAASKDSVGIYGDGNNGTTLFGLRGSEDLGNGLKAGFNLESGLNIANGGTNGPNGGGNNNFFNRAANVSLSTENYGLTVGNQFANAVLASFVYGGTGVGGDGANVPAMVRLFGGAPGAVDHATTNSTSSVFFVPQAAQVSFNVAGLSGNVMSRINEVDAANSGYTGATIGTSFAGVNAALGHQVARVAGAEQKTTFVAANTSFGDLRVNAAVADNSGAADATTYVVGASMPIAAGLAAGLTYAKGTDAQGKQTTGSLEYALSKRTMGYLNYTRVSVADSASGNTAYGLNGGKHLTTIGLRHNF